jgi:hypothetical protein
LALSLLERVKNKALEALQGFGNFVAQDFQKSPVGRTIDQVQNIPRGAPQRFADILGGLAQTQINQPIIPLLGKRSPTIKDTASTIADFTYRPVARMGAEGVQTLQGDMNEYDPAKDFKNPAIAKFLYGDKPLQNINDPDRPGRKFAKSIGREDLALPLIAAGATVDAIPFNPGKIGGKGGIKLVAKASKSFDEFVELATKNKKVLQEANAIIKDTKNPIQNMEQIYAKYGPQAGKKTADLIKEAKQVAPKVEEIVIDASKPGNLFKKKSGFKKLFEDTTRSSKGVIGRSGPAGREIVRRLDLSEADAANLSGAATAKLQAALKSLKGAEIDTFADATEGIIKPISKTQKEAIKVWREIAEDVVEKSKEVNLGIGYKKNYFPHQILELSNADKRVFAEQMVASGKYKTEAEALQALDNQIKGELSRTAQRRFGNLELARETDLPYNKSPNVLFDYINNAYGRIADVKNFGARDEELYKLAKAVGTQGGDSNQVLKYLDQILGKNQSPNKIANALTSWQTITKLSPVTSAVNLTQNLSTWLRTDTPTMAKTIKNIMVNPKRAYANATKAGEITPSMARELQDYIGTGKAATKWIRLIGMHGTEKFNRVVAVNAGIEYGQKLAKQAERGSRAAIRELDRFGIGLKDIKNGALTDDALRKIGRQLSGETQFSTKAGELPYFWRTNVGKVVTQFKSFAYKQTGFVAKNTKRVLSETRKGNLKPLINSLVVYGISAPIAGEIVNDWRSLIRNKSREDTDSLTERYFSNILAASSFGLLDSTSGLLGEYGLAGTVSTIGGPSVGDAQKIVTAATDAQAGLERGEGVDPYMRTTRNIVKSIPGVGQPLANTFIPNSYVDNNNIPGTDVNLGVNTGEKLDEPEAQDGGFVNTVSKLFGGSKAEAQGNSVSWKNEKGNTVTVSLSEEDLSGKTGVDAYDKTENSPASKAVQIWGSPLPEEQKLEAFKKLGFEPDDVRYAYKTRSSFTNDERTTYIRDQNLDHDTLVDRLITGRVESITGRYFATEGVINNLVDEGLLSKEEGKYLKNLKIVKKDGKFTTVAGAGGSGGGASNAKVKAYIKSLNSLYKDSIATTPTQKKTAKAPEPRTSKAPKLNLATSKKGGKKSSAQWFTAY